MPSAGLVLILDTTGTLAPHGPKPRYPTATPPDTPHTVCGGVCLQGGWGVKVGTSPFPLSRHRGYRGYIGILEKKNGNYYSGFKVSPKIQSTFQSLSMSGNQPTQQKHCLIPNCNLLLGGARNGKHDLTQTIQYNLFFLVGLWDT